MNNINQTINWLFGIIVLGIGIINTFWGNDPIFGMGLLGLSLVYLPPSQAFLVEKTHLRIPNIAKIILGAVILWAALGVGELFDKIKLMQTSL